MRVHLATGLQNLQAETDLTQEGITEILMPSLGNYWKKKPDRKSLKLYLDSRLESQAERVVTANSDSVFIFHPEPPAEAGAGPLLAQDKGLLYPDKLTYAQEEPRKHSYPLVSAWNGSCVP